jgi:hypothetical protein
MRPPVRELEAGADDEVLDGARGEHLTGLGRRHHARAEMDGDTRQVIAPHLALARVDARANVEADRSSALAESAAVMLAATHPDRVSQMVQYGTFARLPRSEDNPEGIPLERTRKYWKRIVDNWGDPDSIDDWAPSVAAKPMSRWLTKPPMNSTSAGPSPKTV